MTDDNGYCGKTCGTCYHFAFDVKDPYTGTCWEHSDLIIGYVDWEMDSSTVYAASPACKDYQTKCDNGFYFRDCREWYDAERELYNE